MNGALAVVEQGLATYARERVLEQLRSTLLRARGLTDTGTPALEEGQKAAATAAGDGASVVSPPEFAATHLIPPTRDFPGAAASSWVEAVGTATLTRWKPAASNWARKAAVISSSGCGVTKLMWNALGKRIA